MENPPIKDWVQAVKPMIARENRHAELLAPRNSMVEEFLQQIGVMDKAGKIVDPDIINSEAGKELLKDDGTLVKYADSDVLEMVLENRLKLVNKGDLEDAKRNLSDALGRALSHGDTRSHVTMIIPVWGNDRDLPVADMLRNLNIPIIEEDKGS